MIYLGLLVNITNYINLNLNDIKYYAILLIIISTISYVVNKILGTNFMFISNNFPNTPVEFVYNLLGKFFTAFMVLIQTFGPFYVVYFIKYCINGISLKKELIKN
jgi:uncharacterized membrane protein YwaF